MPLLLWSMNKEDFASLPPLRLPLLLIFPVDDSPLSLLLPIIVTMRSMSE